MSKKTVFWVSPTGNDAWQVKRAGATEPLSLPPTKEQAVNFGRQVARDHQPSQLFVQRSDGTIENEFTYGSDPYPPEG